MRSIIVALASLPLLAATAHAQEAPPPARVGLEVGVGLGGGKIYCEAQNGLCDDFTEAGGANLSIAYMLTPKIGLMGDVWAMSHRDDDFTFTHYVNTIGVKLRPLPILTFTLGIGAAHATLDYRFFGSTQRATSDDAAALMGAAAVDVIRSKHWALSVEARFGNGFYGDENDDGEADVVGRNVSLGAAFTFFNL